ncbi:MAG: DMT family transporter [Tumebacillaceae bacterium]
MRAILFGILGAFFFSFTFILNRSMNLSGGSWVWSSSLRYFFMVPLLLLIVMMRGNLKPLLLEMRRQPWLWVLWSTVGFGLFYAPITFASGFGASWLMASTWQITIICGSLLVPLFHQKIPVKGLLMSLIILLGVALMQVEQATQFSVHDMLLCVLPVIVAAFAYPLGNRKMMEVVGDRLDTFQRVLGMTIASLPFWLLLSVYGAMTDGAPRGGQVLQTLLVALSSGVIATVLFFYATDLAKHNVAQLAAVEATQAGEVVFTILGEVVVLGGLFPQGWSLLGMVLVVVGMILHSLVSQVGSFLDFIEGKGRKSKLNRESN